MELNKILLLISDSNLADRIEQGFYRAKFDVMRTSESARAINLLKNESPHAMLIDGDYSKIAISEINRLINENYRKTALILLSENKKVTERIKALEAGADECFAEIPELEELIAKVKAIVRRIYMVDNIPRLLRIKDIDINLDTHEVRKNGQLIDLTYTQFKLLYLLASRRDYIFSRNEILEKVWGEHAYVTDRTVDVHVKRLREKLGEDKHPSKYIQTIHGLGYRFA